MNQFTYQNFIYQQKQAWASLKKKPSFIATIVSTMGFTLGTLLCVLTLAYVLILSSLPYPKPDSLYRVDSVFVKGKEEVIGNFFTYPGAIELHKNQQLFSQTAILFYGNTKIESDPLQPNVLTTYTTPEWFSLLGAKLQLGRAFGETEAIDTNNPVVILSYQTWKILFSGDKNILDKSITLSGKSFRVVGVLAESFIEPRLREDGKKTEIYLPWDFNPAKAEREQAWGQPHPDIAFFGNLSSSLNKDQADQRLTENVNSIWKDKVTGLEFWKGCHIQIKLQPFKSVILGSVEKAIYLLLVAVMGLVLIALANISNLFMSRIAEQQRQLSIQAALGATQAQLFKSFLAETGQLMLASILLALAVAQGGFVVLQRFCVRSLPRVEELSINGFTLGAAILIAIILALVFARLSSRMINYKALQASLQTSGKGAGVQVSARARKLLIICQVAIASILIFINLNVFKEAYKVIYQPMGFETKNTYVLALNTWAETAESVAPAVADLAQKLEALPQVSGVSQSYSPLDIFDYFSHKPLNRDESIMVQTLPIDNKYFGLIGQPLLEGKNFSEADARDSNKVIIIDEVYAKRLAPNGSALGLQILLDNNTVPSTVVGVVKSLSLPNEAELPMRAYYPFPPDKFRLKLLLKLKEGQVLTPPQIINAIKEVRGEIGFWDLSSLDARRNELLFTQFTTAITSSLLVIVSYLLATIGIYGVLNYSVQLRRFELGIRMAIGARPNTVFMQILKDNLVPVMFGLAVALAVMLGLYLWVQHTNYNIQTTAWAWLMPVLLILSLTAATSLLSVWQIIRKPASYALRGN
jgi:predicted permease